MALTSSPEKSHSVNQRVVLPGLASVVVALSLVGTGSAEAASHKKHHREHLKCVSVVHHDKRRAAKKITECFRVTRHKQSHTEAPSTPAGSTSPPTTPTQAPSSPNQTPSSPLPTDVCPAGTIPNPSDPTNPASCEPLPSTGGADCAQGEMVSKTNPNACVPDNSLTINALRHPDGQFVLFR